jgi:hypothetical protein
MNKAIVWIPLAFIAGGLVGYWGPSEELRAVRKKADVEKPRPAAAADGFGSFAKLVQIPETASPRRARRRRAEPRDETSATNVVEVAAQEKEVEPAVSGPAQEAADADRHGGGMSPDDLRARIEEASDLWRARTAVARAKTVERLGLDKAGCAKFDEAVAAMNEKLRDSMEAMAEMLAEQESMTPELGIRLMGDLSTTLADAYDAIGECAAPEMRGEVSSLMLHDFIDPSVAEPLIAVQGKLGGGMGREGGF